MTPVEIHRLMMDSQAHIEYLADMWFGLIKFTAPCLICYCLGWAVARVSEKPIA